MESGALPSQTRLPSERELSDSYRITRMTVRQALRQLEAEGLIYRLDRRGWFVSPSRLRYNPTANMGFTENVRSQGKVPGTLLLSKEMIPASSWATKYLAVTEGEPVFLIRRLRSIDDRAVLVEQLYVNATRCPKLLERPLEQSLTDLLEKHYGIVERRARITMRPTALNEVQAQALQVAVGTPGLYLTRTILDQFDNVIEFDQEFWRHDVLEVEVDTYTDGGITVSRNADKK
jgi:DNA-binding GntR family transcriptional regulator